VLYPEVVDDAELAELLDAGRTVGRRRSRSRERTLRQVAEEGASLVGTLLDLAEAATPVTLRTDADRTHHGVLVAVGADFCVVRAGGADTCVRTSTVTTVRPRPGGGAAVAAGDRLPVRDVRLVEVLGARSPDRPRVVIVVRGGAVVAGELRAAGVDVVSLRLDGGRRELCYLAAGAVTEVTFDR
jgi:hypothetical protein